VNRVAIVISTFNEADNLPELVNRLRESTPDAHILVVDDNSPDGTSKVAAAWDCEVITRTEDRGLAQSIICGIQHVIESYDIMVIMDADLSHDPHDVPRLLAAVESGNDFVIGSRFISGGSTPGWSRFRRFISWISNFMTLPLTGIHDLSTGFWALRTDAIDVQVLRPTSWKIAFEIYFKGSWNHCVEVPITFRSRNAGDSKFNAHQIRISILHFLSLQLRSWVDIR